MGNKLISSVAALLAGSGLALAQTPPPAQPIPLAAVPGSYTAPRDTQPVATDAPSGGSPYPVSERAVVVPDPRADTVPAGDQVPAGPVGDKPAPAGCCGPVGCLQSCFSGPGTATSERLWASAEYLVWWIKSNPTPPLVGTLPAIQAVQNLDNLPPGAIGHTFGGGPLRFGEFSGGRFTAGGWLDAGQNIGVEGSLLFLERRHINFGATSAGDPVIGPVLFDATANKETIIVPVNPADAVERARGSASERLWGYEINARHRVVLFGESSIDVLAGFRYLDLQDDLFSQTSTTFLDFGTRTRTDFFNTRDQFYGGQVGGVIDLREGPWALSLIGKIGFGNVHQTININGSTLTVPFTGTPQLIPGGVLALPSNIGSYHHNESTWLPEFTANLGYQFNGHLRVFIGYTFLYMNHVVRPGDVIDAVNPASIPNVIVPNPSPLVRPAPLFKETNVWAQGINFGLEYRY
jgi:hypothetical protein